jgi:hypothetical protein
LSLDRLERLLTIQPEPVDTIRILRPLDQLQRLLTIQPEPVDTIRILRPLAIIFPDVISHAPPLYEYVYRSLPRFCRPVSRSARVAFPRLCPRKSSSYLPSKVRSSFKGGPLARLSPITHIHPGCPGTRPFLLLFLLLVCSPVVEFGGARSDPAAGSRPGVGSFCAHAQLALGLTGLHANNQPGKQLTPEQVAENRRAREGNPARIVRYSQDTRGDRLMCVAMSLVGYRTPMDAAQTGAQ